MNIVPAHAATRDEYVTVDGLRTRYIAEGEGPVVLFLHGASLGSSADVFARNLPAFAARGFRAIAFDQPGFGLSEMPTDHSGAYRRDFILKFIDALGLGRVAVVGHSQAGGPAVSLALKHPGCFTHVVVLGTGSLLPGKEGDDEGRDAAAQQRLERRMAASEPAIEDTRKLLEQNLFRHELITPEELALRHRHSTGRNFAAFLARSEGADASNKKGPPLWQRLTELEMPLLMIYGRNDRAHAAERAALLKEKYPELAIHVVDDCKHLVPWDAADAFIRLTAPFLRT